MKKRLTIIPLVFLLCFSLSCQQGEEVAEDAKQQNAEKIVQKWIDMYALKDLNMIDDIYLDEAIFEDVPDLATYEGKDKIRKFMGELFGYSPDTKVETKATFLGKDWAIVEWIWSGTQTGDIEGVIEATGKRFSIRGASIFEFQDGKIKRQSDYYNAGRFLYQLGVKFVFPTGKILEKKE